MHLTKLDLNGNHAWKGDKYAPRHDAADAKHTQNTGSFFLFWGAAVIWAAVNVLIVQSHVCEPSFQLVLPFFRSFEL